MSPDRRPRAERLRTHRIEMDLARAEGCTLAEARLRLATRAAEARWQATDARITARQRARALSRAAGPSAPPPWMMAD